MQDDLLLIMLKQDLEILHTAKDSYLTNLLKVAKEMIAREGIALSDNFESNGLVTMYAAWLYRKRVSGDAMPRMLRAGLNNLLFSQKATVATNV